MVTGLHETVPGGNAPKTDPHGRSLRLIGKVELDAALAECARVVRGG